MLDTLVLYGAPATVYCDIVTLISACLIIIIVIINNNNNNNILQSQKIFYNAKERFLHPRGLDSGEIFKVGPQKKHEKPKTIVKYNKNFTSTSVDFVSIQLAKKLS